MKNAICVKLNKSIKLYRYEDCQTDIYAWRRRFIWLNSRLHVLTLSLRSKSPLIGSKNNGTAGPGSDIDLLVHFQGTEQQKADLKKWLNGWSLSLSKTNFPKTGYKMDGLEHLLNFC